MERLITVSDVMERYRCSRPTARKYIRQCNPYMESPLAVPEWAFREWEKDRMVIKKKSGTDFAKLCDRVAKGERVIVPRRR